MLEPRRAQDRRPSRDDGLDKRHGACFAWSHYTKNTFIEFEEEEDESERAMALRRERSAPAGGASLSIAAWWAVPQRTAIPEAAPQRVPIPEAAVAPRTCTEWSPTDSDGRRGRSALRRSCAGRRSMRRCRRRSSGRSSGHCSGQSGNWTNGPRGHWSSGSSSGRGHAAPGSGSRRRLGVSMLGRLLARTISRTQSTDSIGSASSLSRRQLGMDGRRLSTGVASQRGTPARLSSQPLSRESSLASTQSSQLIRVSTSVASQRGTPGRLAVQTLSRSVSQDSQMQSELGASGAPVTSTTQSLTGLGAYYSTSESRQKHRTLSLCERQRREPAGCWGGTSRFSVMLNNRFMALQSHEVVREEIAIGMEDEEEEDEDEHEQHEEEVEENMQERDDDADDDDDHHGRTQDDLAEQEELGHQEHDACRRHEEQEQKETLDPQDQDEQERQVLEQNHKQEERGEHKLQEQQDCEKQSQDLVQEEPKWTEDQQEQDQRAEQREHEEPDEQEEQEELDHDGQDCNEGCPEQGQQSLAEWAQCDAGKPVSSKAAKRQKKRAARASRKKTANDDSAAVAVEPSSSVCDSNIVPGTERATTSEDVARCSVGQNDVGKGNPEPVHSAAVDSGSCHGAQLWEQGASAASIDSEEVLRQSRWAHLQELHDQKLRSKGENAEENVQSSGCTESAPDDGARVPLPDSQADELAEFTVRLSESAVIAHSNSSGCRTFTVVTPIDSCSTDMPDMLSVNLGAVVLCEAADASGWAFGTLLAPKSLAGGRGCLHYGGGLWRPVVVEVQRVRGGFEHAQLSVGTWSQAIESFRGGGTQQRLRQKLLCNRMQAARAAWEAKAQRAEAGGEKDAAARSRPAGRPRHGKRR